MKKVSFFILFFTLFSVTAFAQSAERVSEMIEAPSSNLGSIAYFASTYLGLIGDDAQDDIAISALESVVDISKISNKTEDLSYSDFAYFCTNVWNIKGGIMLRLTNAPRYAFRELKSMGFIDNTIEPSEKVTGIDALSIITRCIDYSIAHGTVDLESISNASTIDFQSIISR